MASTKSPPDLASSLRHSVTRLARILRWQDAAELTPSMSSALATIDRRGPLSMGDLSVREHVAAPTVTRIVEKLERAGLVERNNSPSDGRVSFVAVTEDGRSTMDELRSRRTRWLDTRLAQLPPAERAVLERAAPILERLVEAAAGEQA